MAGYGDHQYPRDLSGARCAYTSKNPRLLPAALSIVFSLPNYRADAINHVVGAGVASVTVTTNNPPVPTAQQLNRYWSDGKTEPWYREVGAVHSGNYMYAFGHAKATAYVHLARVQWQNVEYL